MNRFTKGMEIAVVRIGRHQEPTKGAVQAVFKHMVRLNCGYSNNTSLTPIGNKLFCGNLAVFEFALGENVGPFMEYHKSVVRIHEWELELIAVERKNDEILNSIKRNKENIRIATRQLEEVLPVSLSKVMTEKDELILRIEHTKDKCEALEEQL